MRRFHQWFCYAGLTGLLTASAMGQAPLPMGSVIGSGNPAQPGKTAPLPPSPIAYFRELLALPSAEREGALAGHSPKQRAVLLQKLHEYDILPPEFRETRLRYTQVRWQLLHLMKMEPHERIKHMSEVSAEDRALILERLRLWDKWPAEVQKQFLENEGAMALLLQSQPGGSDLNSTNTVPRENSDFQRWQSLPENQRKELCDRFREFFNLSQVQKKKTLGALPLSQCVQMEKSVQALEGLSPEQRKQRLNLLQKFAAMPLERQQRFMKNATLWQAMSPQERALWRNMSTNLPPLPPLPPNVAATLPPMPPGWAPMPPTPKQAK